MESKVELEVYKQPFGFQAGAIQAFLDKFYPVQLPWSENNMVILVCIEHNIFRGRSDEITGKRIVGVCAMVHHDIGKVHVYALAVADDLRRKGWGTEMLKRVSIMYPTHEITVSVTFDEANLLNFYTRKGYARPKEINTELGTIVLSLVQLKLIADVPLPD